MENKERVIVLDFGGQYNQLIARRVRECNVYCEILPYTVSLDKIKELNPTGIIFTGGPNSVYQQLFSEIVTPVLTSNHRLHIIKPIEIVGNTKIPAEAQHNKNRNAKHPLFYSK